MNSRTVASRAVLRLATESGGIRGSIARREWVLTRHKTHNGKRLT